MGLQDTPGNAEWLAVFACWGLTELRTFLRKRRPSRPTSSEPGGLPRAALVARLVLGGCILVASAPLVASVALGAPVEAILWWFLLAPLAVEMLALVAGSLVWLAAYGRGLWRTATPDHRVAMCWLAVVSSGTALLVPAAIVAATAVGAGLQLAVAIGVTVGYVPWPLLMHIGLLDGDEEVP